MYAPVRFVYTYILYSLRASPEVGSRIARHRTRDTLEVGWLYGVGKKTVFD